MTYNNALATIERTTPTLRILNNPEYFRLNFTDDYLNQHSIDTARKGFNTLVQDGIIIDGEFDSNTWKLCNEYEAVRLDFASITVNNFDIIRAFAIPISKWRIFLKTFIVLNFSKYVITTWQTVICDLRTLFSVNFKSREQVSLTFPYVLQDFLSGIQPKDEDTVDNIMDSLDSCMELNISKANCTRELASFSSYLIFNEMIRKWWADTNISDAERLFFCPVYLWWQITAIIPLRPREFILTPRNCLSERDGNYYLDLRKSLLKGSSGGKIKHHKISSDYKTTQFCVTKALYDAIQWYIDHTENCEVPAVDMLLRAEPHYAAFHHLKPYTSRHYSYINLSTCLRKFYSQILEKRYGLHIVTFSDYKHAIATGNEIQFIHLGDTRHLAMMNILFSDASPEVAMSLAGHSSIDMASHYYSGNVDKLVECYTCTTFNLCNRQHESVVASINHKPPTITGHTVTALDNGCKCHSPYYAKGDFRDCMKNFDDDNNTGYGFCDTCCYYEMPTETSFTMKEIRGKKLNENTAFLRKCFENRNTLRADTRYAKVKYGTAMQAYKDACIAEMEGE